MPSEKQIEAATTAIIDKIKADGFIGYREAVSIILTAAEQAEPAPILPEIPDDDRDFTPELARKIIAKYQDYIRSQPAPAARSGAVKVVEDTYERYPKIMDRLAALEPAEPATDVEPEAWLMRDQGTTVTLNKVQADEWGWDGKDIQPLYTHPPESRLREALEHVTELLVDTWNTKMEGDPERQVAVRDARAALAQGADDERS